jgi:hypothetical protein
VNPDEQPSVSTFGLGRTARTARRATVRSTTPRCGTATASTGRVRTHGSSA